MKNHIIDIFVSLAIAASIVAASMAFAMWMGCSATSEPQELAECLDSIQQVDNSATSVTEGDGIVYESFICETVDYDYVITRGRRVK